MNKKKINCPSPENPCICLCHLEDKECWECRMGRHKPKQTKPKKKICKICGKPVGEQGKLYIAGSICEGGHIITKPKNRAKNKKKCPMTLSGKHIWEKVFRGIDYVGYTTNSGAILGETQTIIKCLACGMIDDTKHAR